jgi:hypothetical protein
VRATRRGASLAYCFDIQNIIREKRRNRAAVFFPGVGTIVIHKAGGLYCFNILAIFRHNARQFFRNIKAI